VVVARYAPAAAGSGHAENVPEVVGGKKALARVRIDIEKKRKELEKRKKLLEKQAKQEAKQAAKAKK
jgi:hypothetical protein